MNSLVHHLSNVKSKIQTIQGLWSLLCFGGWRT